MSALSVPPVPTRLARENRRSVTKHKPSIIPFVTQRRGEDAAPENLAIVQVQGRYRLYYRDEDVRDRDLRGTLWARCGFNRVDEHQMPTGEPQWKMMHPYRQMVTMQAMRCQVCTQPARTPLGYVFLTGPEAHDPHELYPLTNQPPVCAKHVRTVAALCPHMKGEPVVRLALSAPLYGVHGTLYGIGRDGIEVIAKPNKPLPYGHKNMSTFLGSQQVRRLKTFRVLTVDQLMRELRATEDSP